LPGRRPTFSDFLDEYLASPIHAQKKQSTQVSERASLEHWREHLGGIRIDKITEVMVKSYCEKRLAQGVTARTANKETVAFYQVLRLANDRGLISSLPRVRQLKQKKQPCVMAGIDFMTIAHWLGNSDGGVLVGKVHGHLAHEHKKRMADNLSILKTPANVIRISA
jgi:site-specific recombinase XerD